MQKRLRNFFVNGAHLLLAMLLVFCLFGTFPGGFAAACVTVSTLSMLLLITQSPWTCQSAVTGVVEALGVPIEKYERGLLGLGTGALDLPNPIEFIDDSAYELLTIEHQQAFEASRAASDPTDK